MTREKALKVIRDEINLCEEESVDALELEDVYSFVKHSISLDRIKETREEINSKIESVVGTYKGDTPFEQMPSAKIHRNNARKECLEILDKLIAEVERGGADGN